MKIFIMTDLEGVAGVYDQDNFCRPEGRYYETARRLLTEEVNAAVRGFYRAGTDEIIVQIGHRTDSIDRELLDEHALLVSGHSLPIWPWGLDITYDALAFIGQHAKAGTEFSHLAHTGNKCVLDQRINGLSIGEYGALALCAMELGIPTILAAGERALCNEASALTPGVCTVSGKYGIEADCGRAATADFATYSRMNTGACHSSPRQVRQAIETTAEQALKLLRFAPQTFRYPKLSPPYFIIREHRPGDGPNHELGAYAVAGECRTIAEGLNHVIYNPNSKLLSLQEARELEKRFVKC